MLEFTSGNRIKMEGMMAETEIQKIEADVKKVFSFGLSHLVLIGLLMAAMCASIYLYDSRRADQADSRAALAETTAQLEEKQNAAVQQQNEQTLQAVQQSNLLLQQQVAALIAATQQRDANLLKDQVIVKTMTPPVLATKWGEVANDNPPAIDSTGNFIVPLPLALKS